MEGELATIIKVAVEAITAAAAVIAVTMAMAITIVSMHFE